MLLLKSLIFFLFVIFAKSTLSPPTTNNQNLTPTERKIVEYIRNGKFHDAEKLIKDYNINNSRMKIIIEYMISAGSPISTVINFTMSTEKSISYNVLKELSFAIEEANNLSEYCAVYKALNQKIILSPSSEQDEQEQERQRQLVPEALSTLQRISMKIVNNAAPIMIDYLRMGNLTNAQNLANQLSAANEIVFDKTICKALIQIQNGLTFYDLVKIIWNFDKASQKASALRCIHGNSNRNMAMDDTMIQNNEI